MRRPALDHHVNPRESPRLGWVTAPSPVEAHPALAERLGLQWFGVKRDDLLPALHGGTKVRKLDFLLAAPPWSTAPGWAAAGAMGSGQLAALAAAAQLLGKTLHAHVAWQTPTGHAIENLAFLSTRAQITDHGSRVRMALRHPALLRGGTVGGLPVVPPGASAGPGLLGPVEAGLELAAQVERGDCPLPDEIVVPFGSGGTAVGLAVGLRRAGLPTLVRAVACVERPLAAAWRVRGLLDELGEQEASLRVEHGHVGDGYGVPSDASEAAVATLVSQGISAEPVYGGKAMAALLANPPRGKRVLFWHTARRGPLPVDPRWRERLPGSLQRRLDGGRGRRLLLAGGLAAAAAIALRTSGYPDRGFTGAVLADWEAEVVRALGEAVATVAHDPELAVATVDHFLTGLSPFARAEVHGLLALVEHGLGVQRFTSMDPAGRREALARLASLGSLPAVATRGARDLGLLGAYAQPATWAALGYEGPIVSPGRPDPYAALCAADGVAP